MADGGGTVKIGVGWACLVHGWELRLLPKCVKEQSVLMFVVGIIPLQGLLSDHTAGSSLDSRSVKLSLSTV